MLHQRFQPLPSVLAPLIVGVTLLCVGALVPIAAAPESPPAPPASAQPSPSGGAKPQGITPASNSAWNIISLLGFLLGGAAVLGLWGMYKSQNRLVNRIEVLDQRLKKLNNRQESSNLNRTTQLTSLQDSAARLHSDWQKDHQTLQRLASQVDSLDYHYNALKSGLDRLSQLSQTNVPAPLPNCDDCIAALNRGDKTLLRSLVNAELNITLESEEALQRGTSSTPTRLMEVHGGGSYLLVSRGDIHWLLPTVQTLGSFSANQPQKGIFDYAREAVTVPELLRAAEVVSTEGGWEVVNKGVVIVAV
jgi:uncharacterized protein HemX